MRPATDLPLPRGLETDMKKKALVIGGIAVAPCSRADGPWRRPSATDRAASGPGHECSHGPDGMGPGMMEHMGHGMGHGMMGHGMMKGMGHGMGPGMMHGGPGSAFADAEDIDDAEDRARHHARPGAGLEQVRQGRPRRRGRDEDDARGRRSAGRQQDEPSGSLCVRQQDARAGAEAIRGRQDGRQRASRHARRRAEGQGRGHPAGSRPFGPGAMRGAGMGGPQHRH